MAGLRGEAELDGRHVVVSERLLVAASGRTPPEDGVVDDRFGGARTGRDQRRVQWFVTAVPPSMTLGLVVG